ncbi:alpha/beta hydrolase [Pseudomonas sp. TH43]|uniref:alpha/beta hydrolase n=1 Tax=Pseudomonas sp. TH43 TaxID=2796407 RepID=UPI00191450AE|nr:alpha/beta hydrolase [Pseudomonas sp. TH43]MBK5378588.1 alpha/beta hydrolase [Pseudomonas sp. TH43]
MEVANPDLKNCTKLAASHDLTCKTDQTPKTAAVSVKKVVVFFIGGAGDKEQYYVSQPPHGNVTTAQVQLPKKLSDVQMAKVDSVYLSYKDVRGKKDIDKYVVRHLAGDKSIHISIVGHSLGGWNGAHLSTILKEQGYTVKSLVTLDPVGGGLGVWLISDIYATTPKPCTEFWINILAAPAKPNQSDDIADDGERWKMSAGPDVNVSVNANHESAGAMFRAKVLGEKSACDLIAERIINYLES